MLTIVGIDHIVLRTTQPDTLRAFYCDVLGCSVARETSQEMGLTQLQAGNALIDLVSVDSDLGRRGGQAPGQDGRNLDHFCLSLAPIGIDELARELTNRGIKVGEFAERYGAEGFGQSTYIEDPDGNIVELRSQKA